MKNVSFVPYRHFDAGRFPSIAVNAGGVTIEGHQRQGDSKLFYNVGIALNQSIGFMTDNGTSFDNGAPPRFAINDQNWAVEIHKSNGPSSNLWYHAGPVDPGQQSWDHGDSHKDGSGQDPDIALNNSWVVVSVHEDDGNIMIRTGTLDTGERIINFNDASTLASGVTPTVALNNLGLVVAAYSNDETIYWWLGRVVDGALNPIGSGVAANGILPSIGLTDEGVVVLGFESGGGIFAMAGALTDNGIHWATPQQYANGSNPWVDASGQIGVHAFPGGDALSDALMAGTSPIYQRSTWMGDSAQIQAKALRQLVFPGSHDAGMAITQDCTSSGRTCNTRTQFIDIGQQLEMGSRYFDLRPALYQGAFFTGHYSDTEVPIIGIQGCNGQSLGEILDQTAAFLLRTQQEVAILKFSHYYDKDNDKFGFNSEQMQALIDLVLQKLPGLLFVNTTDSRLADIALSGITANGSRAIAVFDEIGALADPSAGIYSYADYNPGSGLNADLVVFDRFSSTNDLAAMETDQWAKQADTANHGGDLFLLSWTLTQSGIQAATCGVPGVDSITTLANKAAAAFFAEVISRLGSGEISQATLPNVLYLDICNGFGTDVAILVNGVV
ncbi:MAG: hypothetical protein U0176_15445 [Bacteroidia bacterium]